MRPALALTAAIIAATALAACGSAMAHSHGSSSRNRPHTSAATGGTLASPSATSTASTSSSALPRCLVSHLSLARPTTNGAAGSIGLRFTFTNRSTASCTLLGYPGIGRLNGEHKVMTTTVVRGTSTVVPAEPERTVVLAPGGRASFFAGYSDVPGGSACPTSAYLEVTPPNAYDHFTLPVSADVCRATITVSPVVAGVPPV
jgi:ABC-type Fe3+-hydroxamate transport system substrate-binding protein